MSVSDAGRSEGRLLSLDAYRGFVMLAMASAGLGIGSVSQYFPDNQVWLALDRQAEHVAWRGCSFWDLIQPSFMFIVGVAMPFSYASRRAAGQTGPRLLAHSAWRSLVLIALGVFLASAWGPRTQFVFTNVLAQIGLGYTVVFLLLGRGPRVQLAAAVVILVGYWLLFALHPPPPLGVASPSLGLPMNWRRLEGFAAHWEKNVNIAAAFDRWFLNLFPRPNGAPFVVNDGGYATLNFIPSIATMLFGVLAGEWLRASASPGVKVKTLLIVGALGIAVGTALDISICPVVKRIWTPSWVIYSTGWTCGLLAVFHGTIDVAGYRRWAWPLLVVGVNSMAMYLMAQLAKPFISEQIKIHLGRRVFDVHLGRADFGAMVQSTAVLLVLWLACLWLYRRKIFVKI